MLSYCYRRDKAGLNNEETKRLKKEIRERGETVPIYSDEWINYLVRRGAKDSAEIVYSTPYNPSTVTRMLKLMRERGEIGFRFVSVREGNNKFEYYIKGGGN